MSTISTSGISIGQIIKSEHLLRIIRALDGTVSNDIIISGSLTIEGPVTGSTFTGSFIGDGSGLTGIPTGSGEITGSIGLFPIFTSSNTIGDSNIRINANQDGIHINYSLGTPENTAVLQIDSQDKGVLFPRMKTNERTDISSSAQGLMVYDTDLEALCIFIGGNWYTFDLTVI